MNKNEYKIYTGSLNRPSMEYEPKRAYEIFHDQRKRCNNKTHKSYKYYGAKGIKVEYSSREFIYWWLNNIKKFSGSKPSTGRLDHSKNYSFDNIRIESMSDNIKEVHKRYHEIYKRNVGRNKGKK